MFEIDVLLVKALKCVQWIGDRQWAHASERSDCGKGQEAKADAGKPAKVKI